MIEGKTWKGEKHKVTKMRMCLKQNESWDSNSGPYDHSPYPCSLINSSISFIWNKVALENICMVVKIWGATL